MKNVLVFTVAALAISSAFAGGADQGGHVAPGTAQQQQQGQQQSTESSSASHAETNGNTQQIVIEGAQQLPQTTTNVNYGGSQTIRNVPSVNGPALTSSNDTCMGSTTGSVNFPGFGGSLGTTWTDDNCVMLKNSREMWNMGMKAAGLARMCMDENNRAALEVTGYKCPDYSQRQATPVQVLAPQVDRGQVEGQNSYLN